MPTVLSPTSSALSPSAPVVYTADEVAAILRCNRETVYRWVKKGRLKSCSRDENRTRAYRFTQQHLDDFLGGPGPTEAPQAAKPSRNPKKYPNG